MSRERSPSDHGGEEGRRPTWRLPVVVGLVIFSFGPLFAHLARQGQDQALVDVTRASLQNIASELQSRMAMELRALNRFGERWEIPPEERVQRRGEWERQAQRLVDDFPHIQAVEWADRTMRVRWIVPLEGNAAAVGLDLGFEERRRQALIEARDRREIVATPPVELVQGGTGFLVYSPLFPASGFDGFVLAVYRTDLLLGDTLANVAPGWGVRVRDANGEIFSSSPADGPSDFTQEASIQVTNLEWTVSATPYPEVVATFRTSMPLLIIVASAINGSFFGFALYQARANRQRAKRLQRVIVRLNAEMERRERAEAAEEEARTELRTVVDNLPDHVWSGTVGDPAGSIVPGHYSPIIEEISGVGPDRFREDPGRWIDCIHGDDRSRVSETYLACFGGPARRVSLEYRVVRPDGEERWVRDRIKVTPRDVGVRLDGVITDITEMKRAEVERLSLEAGFLEAQKRESLGVLAGGVAHDFNNLLVGVLGNASLALDELPPGSPARGALMRIEKAGKAAAELCRQMLAYVGKASLPVETVDLREAVGDIGELVLASTSKRISVRYEFTDADAWIEGDASQIRQVAMNLITNAAEAIGDAFGNIEIAVRSAYYDRAALEGFDFGSELPAGDYVELRVSDDGCGMDEETRRRLFEPFFTGKFTGRGLGLAAVQGIVRSHCGAIALETAVEEGTSISVLFPAVSAPETLAPEFEALAEGWRGEGTVLLVDDQIDARELGELVLEGVGFRVLTASDGLEGVKLFEANSDEIVCVLLDLTMPKMDGVAAHARMHALRSDVPVILCSGYPEPSEVDRFVGEGPAAFLQKPFTPKALVECVRQVMLRSEGRGSVS